MSPENIYILLKISNYIMICFQYMYVILFLMVLILKVSKKDILEKVSISRFIKEIVFSLLLLVVLFFQNEIDITLIILWMFMTGVIIGALHSLSFNLLFEDSTFKINSRYLFSIVLGISVFFTEFSFLYMKDLLNISFVLMTICIGISVGLSSSFILKIDRSR